MKKHLTNNLLTSGAILIALLLASFFLSSSAPLYYFLAVLFFLCTYTIQAIFLTQLGTTPQRFLMIYNYITVLKMLTSIGFLAGVFFSLDAAASHSDKIYFSLFFLVLYFLFLIINTKSFFSNNNERTSQ